MRESLMALERHNVVKALVSGSIEMVEEWKSAAPDRLIPSPVISYGEPWPKMADLRAAYSQRKLGLSAKSELNAWDSH